uniref:Uncharacterized protein n=1 Tax=Fusarium oxysporum (strain Fo5176) TaxID=660025 RepID=A0A0D2XPV0_FUSOF
MPETSEELVQKLVLPSHTSELSSQYGTKISKNSGRSWTKPS